MAEEVGEVRIKLVVDSDSSKVVDEVKEDMEEAEDAAKDAGKKGGEGFAGGMKAGAVAVGMIYAQLAAKALEFAKAAIIAPLEAFKEGDAAADQLTNTFAIFDSAGNSMEHLKQLAADVKGEIGDLAKTSGVAGSVLTDAFNTIIERGGRTVEEAVALTGQMAYAGKIVQGGAEALADGFKSIEQGAVKAKNPIVQLISTTGMLKGNAASVAKQMAAMTIDKQMELAEQAVGRAASKARQIPMTLAEIETVMREVQSDLLETAGAPMTEALGRSALHVKEMFVDAEGAATPLMNKLVSASEFAGDLLSGVFEGGAAFVDGFVDGLSIFGEEFAIIWDEIFGRSDQGSKNLIDAAQVAGEIIGGFVKFFAAGVGTLILAAQKVVKYIIEGIGLLAEGLGDLTGWEGAKSFGQSAQQLAFSAEQEDKLAAIRSTGTSADEAARLRTDYQVTAGFTSQGDADAKIAEAFAARQAMEDQIANAKVAMEANHADAYWEAFNEAKQKNDQAAMRNIASFLGNNAKMAEAIGKLGPEIIGGAKDDFLKQLTALGAADAAEALKKASRVNLGPSSRTNITQNFTGPVNVKQDFKNADPNEVMVIFKTKLASAGTDRLQSRFASPFGF